GPVVHGDDVTVPGEIAGQVAAHDRQSGDADAGAFGHVGTPRGLGNDQPSVVAAGRTHGRTYGGATGAAAGVPGVSRFDDGRVASPTLRRAARNVAVCRPRAGTASPGSSATR